RLHGVLQGIVNVVTQHVTSSRPSVTRRHWLPDDGRRHRYRQPQTKRQVAARPTLFRVVVCDRLGDEDPDLRHQIPPTQPSLPSPPRRDGTRRLLRRCKDTPVKPAGAVEIIAKNAYRT